MTRGAQDRPVEDIIKLLEGSELSAASLTFKEGLEREEIRAAGSPRR